MPTHPPNPNDKLREVISRGSAVIVAGTGVSMAASRDASTGKPHPEASWTGLLENGLDWLKQHSLMPAKRAEAHLVFLKEDTDIHHFVSAAQDVTRSMGGVNSGYFADWLARTIGSIKAHDRKALDALEALRVHGSLAIGTPSTVPAPWNINHVPPRRCSALQFCRGLSSCVTTRFCCRPNPSFRLRLWLRRDKSA